MRASLAFAAFAALGPVAGAARAADDHDFLTKALQGDNSEMRLGHMAQERGVSPGTRQFGRALEDDHRHAREMTLPVAQAHGVAPTDEMAPEAREEADKLRGLDGRAFDREFARYMVEDHRKDISDFEKQVRRGDRATARLARETLPTLRKHLRMAERLAR